MAAPDTIRGADFLPRGEAAASSIPSVAPPILPIGFAVSGLYLSVAVVPPRPLPIPSPIPTRPGPIPGGSPTGVSADLTSVDGAGEDAGEVGALVALPIGIIREELRLDVDGRYPLMVASGTILSHLTARVDWVAHVTRTGPNRYTGSIFYKNGTAAALPQTTVTIDVTRTPFPNNRNARATFSGGGAPQRTVVFRYSSAFFHPCEFEYDVVQGTASVTTFDTATHPNKPATLPNEVLSIATVYQRAGINATVSPGSGVIPITDAGTNLQWSDAEMHDAMVHYWSRFADKPMWAAWVLFAALSESGASLGGIMFDSIGPNQRQGTAIFEDSFISTPPAGDPNAAAAVQRLKFWTACHEIGHTFNLAHSWQESLPTPWIPLADEPLARSFMNYPFRVPGGSTAFFADFEYRFSDSELLFMRHAPTSFVEQGFADWFDHHGFRQAVSEPEPKLKLELRANRSKAEFEFLEPVVLELKLTNLSDTPQIVDQRVLQRLDHMTIATKRQGAPARTLRPFARYCYREEPKVLMPGESLYDSLFVAVGTNGWIVADPGNYVIQVALHDDSGDIVSNALMLRITPPNGYTEEYLGQDILTDDVGRVLTFDGSRELTSANATLRNAVEKLSGRRIAVHAQIALGMPAMRDFKSLQMVGEAATKSIYAQKADAGEAINNLSAVLRGRTAEAAETLGHVDTNYYATRFTSWLAERDEAGEAAAVVGDVMNAFELQKVRADVVKTLRDRRATLMADSGVRAPRVTSPSASATTPRQRPSK